MQQLVNFISCFHLHHMTGVWQDMNIGPGQRSVRSGNDSIFPSPDYANWFTEIRKFFTQHYPLLIPIKE